MKMIIKIIKEDQWVVVEEIIYFKRIQINMFYDKFSFFFIFFQ